MSKPSNSRQNLIIILVIIAGLAIGLFIKRVPVGLMIGVVLGLVAVGLSSTRK
jgi:hypothetical protein